MATVAIAEYDIETRITKWFGPEQTVATRNQDRALFGQPDAERAAAWLGNVPATVSDTDLRTVIGRIDANLRNLRRGLALRMGETPATMDMILLALQADLRRRLDGVA